MDKWAFINNDFIKQERAVLHFKDLSFQRGYGVFDYLRLTGNNPLFLEDHLNRLFLSAEGMHLQIAFSREEIKNIIQQLIERNNFPGTGIRLGLTGGYSPDGFTVAKPNFVVSQHSFSAPEKEQVENGIKLLSYPYQRQFSHIKTIDYLMAVWLQPLLKGKGFDDVLYHTNGTITECPRSNFFIVTKNDVLITPSENILAGITRMKVLEIAKQHIKVEERRVSLDEIKTAKEAFITSTTKRLLPVAQIDDVILQERKVTVGLLEFFCKSAGAQTF